MVALPTSTITDLLANVSAQVTDTGTLALVVGVIAIPFAFYFLKKVIALIPKR